VVSRESLDVFVEEDKSLLSPQVSETLFNGSGLLYRVFVSFSPVRRLVSLPHILIQVNNDVSHIDSKPIATLRDTAFLQKLLVAQTTDIFSRIYVTIDGILDYWIY
jgi:hypothetical protein